jgi:hypothetical protein
MIRRARFSLIAPGLVGVMFCTAPQRAQAQAPERGATRAAPASSELAGPDADDRETGARAAHVALAERYAAAAFEAYRVRDYGRAVSLYEQALAAAPSADILYNMARVYDVGLRDRRLAIAYYERYSADPAASPERLDTVTQRLGELRAAELASMGALAEDDPGIARDFPLDAASIAAPRAAPRTESEGLRPLQVTALALGGVGLVGMGLGIGFGLWARTEEDTWRRACEGNACTSQRGVEAAQSAARRAGVATVSLAVGGGLLAASAVLWLLDGDIERPSSAAPLRLTPVLDAARLGGSLSGQF